MEHKQKIVVDYTNTKYQDIVYENRKPCFKSDCVCCTAWGDIQNKTIELAWVNSSSSKKNMIDELKKRVVAQDKIIVDMNERVVAQDKIIEYKDKIIHDKDAKIVELQKDNKKYAVANKDLNAKVNGIKITRAQDKVKSGRGRGRPKGTPATINKKPEHFDCEEIIDCKECPNCGSEDLSDETDRWSQTVTETKVVTVVKKITKIRRYCRKCQKQVSRKAPGVAPYARTSSNHIAFTTDLNVNGFSHQKAARMSKDILKCDMSRSASYRRKIKASKALEPVHDNIKKSIQKEYYIHGDETH